MKRHIPTKVRIGQKYYTVKYVPRLKGHLAGEILYRQRQIKIAKGTYYGRSKQYTRLNKEEQWEVYWHEIVHGILRDMQRHDLNQERFVNAFCRRLYPVLAKH